jgi:protoporphyrinogen oxidase
MDSEVSENWDMIIVGGGVSGLCFGWLCAESGLKTLILEKQSDPGGALKTLNFGIEGFALESGAHTFYNSYVRMSALVDKLGLRDSVIERIRHPFKLWYKNQISSLYKPLNIPTLLWSYFRNKNLAKTDLTVKEYYSRLLGKGNYSRLFQKAFAAVVSQNPDDFPAEILFKKRKRRQDFPKKFTFKKGATEFIEALITKGKFEIRTEQPVQTVGLNSGIWSLQSGNQEIKSQNICMAASAEQASLLLAKVKPNLASLLGQIKTSSVATMALAAPQTTFKLPYMTALIGEPPFYSLVTADPLGHDTYRGVAIHHQVGSNLQGLLDALKMDIENKDVEVYKTSNDLPMLQKGHAQLVDKINGEQVKGLYLCGNYFGGLAVEDCIERAFNEFQRLHS